MIAMAMYHLRVKFVKRSSNQSSVAFAAYRSGERLHDERMGRPWDFTLKSDVEHSEVMLPDNVPDRLRDRETLWNTVETSLSHPRAQPAFEVEVALPRELSHAQCVKLARKFAGDMFVDKGLVVDLNIHRHTASDGGDHPHAHMLIATRRFNPDGTLGKTARDLQDSPMLLKKVYALEQEGKIDEALLAAKGSNLAIWRKAWADYSNDFLADSGSDARIDHRTLEAQKIAREATPNIGFAFHKEIEGMKGWLAERLQSFKTINWRNAMRQQLENIQRRKPELNAEFIAHAREYAKELLSSLEPDRDKRSLDYDR